jgi:F-type H+-transporting ATPase subunit delta
MAEALTLARPYAEAAFQVAQQSGQLPAWSDALERLSAVLDQPQARALLGDPGLTSTQVSDLIGDVAGQLSAEQKNFVGVMAQNERLAVMGEVASLFAQLRNSYEKVLEARVASAYPLSEAQVAEIRATLEAKYNAKVSVQVNVEPDLIGGVSIRIGDEVMDASVRGKLAQLAAALVTQ